MVHHCVLKLIALFAVLSHLIGIQASTDIKFENDIIVLEDMGDSDSPYSVRLARRRPNIKIKKDNSDAFFKFNIATIMDKGGLTGSNKQRFYTYLNSDGTGTFNITNKCLHVLY